MLNRNESVHFIFSVPVSSGYYILDRLIPNSSLQLFGTRTSIHIRAYRTSLNLYIPDSVSLTSLANYYIAIKLQTSRKVDSERVREEATFTN